MQKHLSVLVVQVEALEERMSQLKGELAAKEEHLAQASICSIPLCIKLKHSINNTEDVT